MSGTGPDALRVAVVGAGANGGGIAADLVRAGLDVTVIEQWPEHVAAMRRDGLRVIMPDRETVTPMRVLDLCDVAAEREPFDLVLMLVKAYDATWVARLMLPVLAPDGLLIGVQNGMMAETIASVVGTERTLGCVIEVSSELLEPGIIVRNTPPERSWFALGVLPGGRDDRLELAAAVLGHAGRVEIVDDILSAKWMKLVSNCTTLVATAALGLPMIAALETPGMRALMLRAGAEALAVGQRDGRAMLPIFGLTTAQVEQPETVVEVLLDALYAGFVLPTTTTTVLHDWRRGRRSEAEQLNGLVARRAAQLGIASPANDALIEIARQIERGDRVPEPGVATALQRLASR
ncbi:ketopantoate reductase family protein [Microcella sp.]|uniref:ketopantoate reductase family protein n=1 Tax=Microcella sp. TaxID=1913979 RepID=UPI00391A26A0